MGDQYRCITGSTRCQERPITSLQIVLQVSGDPITPFLLRLPRDRSPPIERLHGGGRGAGVGKRGRLLFTQPRSPLLQLTLRSSINMRTSIILVTFVAALIECSRLTPPV